MDESPQFENETAPVSAAPARGTAFDVRATYNGSNGDATLALYKHLEKLGPAGIIATNLFRASKCSARAKVYRGGNKQGRFRDQAYERKNWSMQNLCSVLTIHGGALGIVWGWKEDPNQSFHCWVLYIELPNVGQVSYHSASPIGKQRFKGEWDGYRNSAERVMIYTEILLR